MRFSEDEQKFFFNVTQNDARHVSNSRLQNDADE
jgi:hypothetical protein